MHSTVHSILWMRYASCSICHFICMFMFYVISTCQLVLHFGSLVLVIFWELNHIMNVCWCYTAMQGWQWDQQCSCRLSHLSLTSFLICKFHNTYFYICHVSDRNLERDIWGVCTSLKNICVWTQIPLFSTSFYLNKSRIINILNLHFR